MIKVYESLQHYITNKKQYFTIPNVVNLSYNKHALQLWDAEVKVYASNIAVKFIDEWSWMDVYDNDNNYIGLYRVKKIGKDYQNGTSVIVYKLVHAFSTMLDDAFLVSETGLTAELNFDTYNSMALIIFMFSKQSTKHWKIVPVNYSGDNSEVKFTRQNGLLKYIYAALEEMGGKYSMIFDTTEYPWKAIIIEAKDKVDCRVREEYNLLSYSMDQDYAPYYNRLYVYGEKDILGAPIDDKRERVKEPEITNDMSQKQIDAAWKRYNENVKKRKEEDAKRKADDKAAWDKYNKDYKAWSEKQIAMQKTRDAALEQRRAEIAAGKMPSGGYLANLPPRPSTVPPPEKPYLQTHETDTVGMSISELNDGKPYIEDKEEIARRGVVSRVVEFKNIKDPKLLMDTAKRIFDARQARTIDLQLTAVELNKFLEEKIPFDDFHLGQHLLMQTKDNGNFDLVIVGEGKNNVYGNPYDIQLDIVEVGGSAGAGSKPHTVSPTDMMLKKMQELQRDILYARKSADGKNTIYTGEVEPVDPEVNDIWYKTVIDPVTGESTVEMYIWNGVIWVNPFESLNKIKEAIEANQKELDAFDAENAAYISKLEDKIKSMADELLSLDKKIQDSIAKDLADLDTKLKSIEGNLNNEVAAKLAAINKTIEDVKNTFGQALTDQEAGILQKVTQQVNKELLTIKDTIAQQKKDVEGLTTKVTDVTKSLDGINARVAAVEESDKGQNERLASIDIKVDGISTSVSEVKKSQEGVTTKLNTVEETANSTKSLLTKEVKDREAAIKEANERISTASSDINRLSQTVTDNGQNTTKRLNEISSDISATKQTISEVKNAQGQTDAKIVTIETNLNGVSTKVTDVEKQAKSNADNIKTNMTAISQTKDSISTIITNYAKKTDLNGLATTEAVNTIVNAKAGEVTSSLSRQITTVDNKVNGIKARPTYTIGNDGYWYKDGVKTSTKATGTDGKQGPQGKPGVAGKDGHTLNVNLSLTGEFRNHMRSNIKRVASATYDGAPISLNNDNAICYYAYGNSNWNRDTFTNQGYPNTFHSCDYIKEKIVVTYKGLTAEATARIDNINDGANGKDGESFGWNLLLGGDTKINGFTDYMVHQYDLVEKIPKGSVVSVVVKAKGKRSDTVNNIMVFNDRGNVNAFGAVIELGSDSDKEFRVYTFTGEWAFSEQERPKVNIYWGNYDLPKFDPVSIEWVKLVYGSNPTLDYVPAKSEINGKIYASDTPPSDHNALWFNTKDKETYTFYNGQWYNINTTIQTKLNTVSDTVDSHKRIIASYDTNFTAMDRGISKNLIKITTLEQNLEGFKTTVKNQNYLSIINQQADKQIFQVSNGKTTGKLMITPTTVYIQDATINSSHISSLSASKLTAGTIDAKQIRVINIDASNITTGKISGYRGYWNLNTGELYNGTSFSNITIKDGVFNYGTYSGVGVVLSGDGFNINYRTTANGSYQHIACIEASRWSNTTSFAANFRIGHKKGCSMTLSYYNESTREYNPYIIFDKYRSYDGKQGKHDHTDTYVHVCEDTGFDGDLYLHAYSRFVFYNGMRIQQCYITMTNGSHFHGIFIGNGWGGSGLNAGIYICTAGLFVDGGGSLRNLSQSGYSIKNVSYHAPLRN